MRHHQQQQQQIQQSVDSSARVTYVILDSSSAADSHAVDSVTYAFIQMIDSVRSIPLRTSASVLHLRHHRVQHAWSTAFATPTGGGGWPTLGRGRPTASSRSAGVSRSPASVESSATSGGSDEDRAPNASVAYSFFKNIRQGSERDIRVLIKVGEPEEDVRHDLDSVQNVQEADDRTTGLDSNIIKGLHIKGYRFLIAKLVYDTADFTVQATTSEKQELDTVNGNLWHWEVTAISPKKQAVITIQVIAETGDSRDSREDERKIAVSIFIDNMTALRRGWIWLGKHPEVYIVSILIPLLTWLFRRRKGNGDKDKEKQKEQEDVAAG